MSKASLMASTSVGDADSVALQLSLEEDFYFFVRYAFLKGTNHKWKRNWHHREICDALMRVVRGECKRLIINIPPRYSKTEIAVVMFIAWCLAKWPDSEFIHASYSGRLAANNSWKARNVLDAEWYKEHFPNTALQYGSNAKDHWTTTAGGVMYSTGAEGTITGFGAGKMSRNTFGGAIIIDDPHKADEATSATMRQNVIDWYQNTLQSRVNNPETPIIVIMQRLHEEDLCGWLLAGGTGEHWEHLCIPAVNDNDEPLWPEKHSREDLRRLESKGSYVFAGQYMQSPAPIGGGIFKQSWWKYYTPGAHPKFRRIVQSWDTAFKEKTVNDPSSCVTVAEGVDGNYYFLDRINDRMEFPALKARAVSAFNKWKPSAVLIEDKASGQSLIQEFKNAVPDGSGANVRLPIVPVKVDTDKVSRAFAVQPLVESGMCYLPLGAPWVEEFLAQLGTFPNAKHDDDVDSTTQALNYLHHNGGNTGLLDYMREEAERLEDERMGKAA